MEMRNERYTELLRDRGVAEYSSEENRCSRQESSGALWPLYCFAQSSASRLPRAVERGLVADPSVFCYSPIALRASRSPRSPPSRSRPRLRLAEGATTARSACTDIIENMMGTCSEYSCGT